MPIITKGNHPKDLHMPNHTGSNIEEECYKAYVPTAKAVVALELIKELKTWPHWEAFKKQLVSFLTKEDEDEDPYNPIDDGGELG